MKILRNICLVDTPYALALYLLMMPMEEIERTKFITGGSLSKSITNQLPNGCIDYYRHIVGRNWKRLFEIRLQRWYKYPSILWSKVYAQDHFFISAQIIGCKSYTLISDGPDYLFNAEKNPNQPYKFIYPPNESLKNKIKLWLAYGNTMYNLKHGTNNQCINRWLTIERDGKTRYVENRKYQYVDLSGLWKNALDEKKKYIMRIFSISEGMLINAKHSECIILTQPFLEDCGLTNDEYIEIYKPYIDKFHNAIIKPHPRDKFDFSKYFPDAVILDTPAPMQLLSYMGINPQVAVTVSSTSISAMPNDTQKIILGTKVNPKIFKMYGDLYNN